MEINILQPIELHLEVIEIDDYVLSMRVNLRIIVPLFQHVHRYEGAFWIECAMWDKFTDALHASPLQEAVLKDISGYFSLTLRRTEEGVLFIWESAKTDISGYRQMNATFSSKIDDDILGKIRNEFLSFPNWW